MSEGPVVRADNEVIFTSVDHGRLYKITDAGCSVFAETLGGANGATEWSDGSIFVAQNGGKWPATRGPGMTGGVQIVDRSGAVRWLTQDPVSPNDLCFGPDGLLYVTDPTRGPARNDGRLWRCSPDSSEAELLCSLSWYPNGIGFGLEDDALYVVNSTVPKGSTNGTIVRFALDNGRLGAPEPYIEMKGFRSDGFFFDADGNFVTVATSTTGGAAEVHTYDRNGKLIDVLQPNGAKHYTNVALGTNRRLIITDAAGQSVLAADDWPSKFLALHPFRAG